MAFPTTTHIFELRRGSTAYPRYQDAYRYLEERGVPYVRGTNGATPIISVDSSDAAAGVRSALGRAHIVFSEFRRVDVTEPIAPPPMARGPPSTRRRADATGDQVVPSMP